MNDINLSVLLVEDDKEYLKLLLESLPRELEDCNLHYTPCDSFDEALRILKYQRFDLVLSDVFRDSSRTLDKIDIENPPARDINSELMKNQPCPMVAFTSGSFPQSMVEQVGPFFKIVDKAKDEFILKAMKEILDTGIPQIANRLHRDLDQATGPDYLWGFLIDKWDELSSQMDNAAGGDRRLLLERLIRRRAAVQLGRLKPLGEEAIEIEFITASEYYIMPPLSEEYKLGHILKRKNDDSIYVVMTPHCHLVTHPGQEVTRADHVLLAHIYPMKGLLSEKNRTITDLNKLKTYIKISPDFGKPRGRYWFLPGFLDIPDSYCDFLKTASVPYETLKSDYYPLAVLDAPFAESLQSCYSSIFASIGVPDLKPEHFMHLIESPEEGNE